MATGAGRVLHRLAARQGLAARLAARLVPFQDLHGQGLADQRLDLLELTQLVLAHQGDGLAAAPGTAGATDAVDVILRHLGQLEVDHVGQLIDVETPCGDVGGNQHPHLAFTKIRQRPVAGPLALVTVDGDRIQAIFLHLLGEPVGNLLGAHEHQHPLPVATANHVGEHLPAAFPIDLDDALAYLLGGGVAGIHLDEGGILEQIVRQRLDVIGEGGGEEQGLTLLRQGLHDAANVGDEPHVEHSVRFIQHQYLEGAQGQGALGQQIQQAARGGDQDVDPELDGVQVRLDADAAIGDQGTKRQVVGIFDDAFAHLGGQLPGRGQHQGSHLAATATAMVGQQSMKHGQGETGRLARACLGAAQHVLPGQDGGNGLLLDGGGLFVTQLLDGPQDVR